jgi:uncharacterized protein YdeI (BOF family)
MKRVLLLMTMLLAMAAIAFSQNKGGQQTNTRSVQGTVTDQSDTAVERAVVQLKDTKTLQIRSFITQQDGSYHFHGLNPDVDYELRAEFQGAGSDTKTLSSFDSRKQAVINLKVQSKK